MTTSPRIRFRDKSFGEARTHYGEAQSQGARDYQEDFQGVHFGVNAVRRKGAAEVDDILLVLADGMGGQNAGDLASRLAVERFMQAYARSEGEPGPRLEQALHTANRALAEAMTEDPRLKGMGCTLVALAVDRGQAWFVSVGDSLLWRFRNGGLTRLNADHSYGAVLDELARRGEISGEKARNSPDRSLLRSALAGGRIEEISRSESPLQVIDGDLFLLASDGLLTLSETQVVEVLRRAAPPGRLARELIRRVEQRGQPEQDNVTVQVLRCELSGRQRRTIPWRLAVGALALAALLGLGTWLGARWIERAPVDWPLDPPAHSVPGDPASGDPASGDPVPGDPGSGDPGSGDPGSGDSSDLDVFSAPRQPRERRADERPEANP